VVSPAKLGAFKVSAVSKIVLAGITERRSVGFCDPQRVAGFTCRVGSPGRWVS